MSVGTQMNYEVHILALEGIFSSLYCTYYLEPGIKIGKETELASFQNKRSQEYITNIRSNIQCIQWNGKAYRTGGKEFYYSLIGSGIYITSDYDMELSVDTCITVLFLMIFYTR